MNRAVPALLLALVPLAASVAACSSLVGAEFDGVFPAESVFGDGGFPFDARSPFDALVALDAPASPPPADGASACAPCAPPFAIGACNGAACTIAACATGHADCDQLVADGCEATVTTDHDHCGSCANACASTQVCDLGVCTTTCGGALVSCSGSCVDTSTNPLHCGSCPHACTTPSNGYATCASGSCGVACYSPYLACNGACVTENASACGASCAVCSAPASGHGSAICAGGSCDVSCTSGYNACFGDCMLNSPSYCGASCTLCPSVTNGYATCSVGGACGMACDAGFHACSTNACCADATDGGTGTTRYYGHTTLLTTTTSASNIYLYGYQLAVTQAGQLSALGIFNGTASSGSHVIIALYTDVSGLPSVLMGQSTAIDLGTTGLLSTPTASIPIPAGTYWLLATYDATPTITYAANSKTNSDGYVNFKYGSPLPTTLTGAQSYGTYDFNYFLALK